ncbi:MAG: hypothetical protein ACKO91_15350 [Acidimicrobiales bacterium]
MVALIEPGRALHADDLTAIIPVPLITVDTDPAVARAVDAGLLTSRLPRTLATTAARLLTPTHPTSLHRTPPNPDRSAPTHRTGPHQ